MLNENSSPPLSEAEYEICPDGKPNGERHFHIDWEGRVKTYPVEPHRQCNSILLSPSQPGE
jgi:hypothetical protein